MTMGDNLMNIPNDNAHNYPFCRIKLLYGYHLLDSEKSPLVNYNVYWPAIGNLVCKFAYHWSFVLYDDIFYRHYLCDIEETLQSDRKSLECLKCQPFNPERLRVNSLDN